MTLIKNSYPANDWKWRCIFIKLSDNIGEKRTPTVKDMLNIVKCEYHLLLKKNTYPLKHKVGKKEYYFYLDANKDLCFKTYENESYKDKYFNWHIWRRNYDINS